MLAHYLQRRVGPQDLYFSTQYEEEEESYSLLVRTLVCGDSFLRVGSNRQQAEKDAFQRALEFYGNGGYIDWV